MGTTMAVTIPVRTTILEPHTILRRGTTHLRFITRSRTAITQQFQGMDITTGIILRIRITTEAQRRTAIAIEALTEGDGRHFQRKVQVLS